jgi:hypothetical protein
MQVTITGGLGHPDIKLQYVADDSAFKVAEKLALQVDAAYSHKTPVYYNPETTLVPSYGYAVVSNAVSDEHKFIDVRGFGAVTIQNDHTVDTVLGGGRGFSQVVIASDGGLNFSSAAGNVTVVSGGGNNFIDFDRRHQYSEDTGSNAVYLAGAGNNTIIGGKGETTISGGVGKDTIYTGGGSGSTTFQFKDMGNAGSATTVYDHITNFNSTDIIKLIGGESIAAINYALNTYTVGAGSSSFSLEDGTKVILNGYTGPLTHANFCCISAYQLRLAWVQAHGTAFATRKRWVEPTLPPWRCPP